MHRECRTPPVKIRGIPVRLHSSRPVMAGTLFKGEVHVQVQENDKDGCARDDQQCTGIFMFGG